MSISALPAAPSRDRPDDYVDEAEAFFPALALFRTEANALAATLNALAGGTAYAIPYTFDSTAADADPTAGKLRLSSGVQNASTVMRLDVLGAEGTDWTTVIDSMDGSTSAVKGQLRIVKAGDSTKWLAFNLTARATPSGYRNLTVVNTGGSSASPFVDGDSLVLLFTRTGDQGGTGTLLRRVSSIVSSAAPTVSATNFDALVITALATAAVLAAPTGSPADEQTLTVRVKDNGAAQALAYNSIFRGSSALPLPTSTTPGTTLRMGFMFNAVDTKWDLVAVRNN
jgi:hypothetical protein